MTQFLAILRVDLRLFLSDRRALLFLLVVPIGIASFMGMLFGGSGDAGGAGGLPRVEIGLVDADGSALSRAVVNAFTNDPNFRVTVTNESGARRLVEQGRLPVAVGLPAGLGENLIPGLFDTLKKPAITIWYDPSHTMERPMVEGLLVPKVAEGAVRSFQSRDFAHEWMEKARRRLPEIRGLSDRDKDRLREMMDMGEEQMAARDAKGGAGGATNAAATPFSLPLPFTLRDEVVAKPGARYNGYAHSFAGMGLQFVLMSMVEFAVSLLRERETGLFRRLRAAPVSRLVLLGGKTAAQGLIGTFSLAASFAFAAAVFGVRLHGPAPGFALVLLASAAMCCTFGLMIAALGRTPAGARGVSIAAVLVLVMLGGAWAPTFIFPEWLQQISKCTPVYWAVEGFDAMTWRGLGMDRAITTAGVLLGYAAAFGAIGFARFKWEG